jgi:nucleoside-diphosphate-sugar epimerase
VSPLINQEQQKRTILLTGATGFLGSYLLKALLSEGYNVVILKRSTSNTWRIANLLSSIKCYNIDEVPLTDAFEDQRIDFVLHTACHYGRNGDPVSQIVETNLMFGLRLLDAATLFNVEAFFNTDTLLQKHLNIYTLSKKHFVEWLQKSCDKIQIVNLKLEHMYGPLDDVSKFVPWILTQFKKNVDQIDLTPGEQLRDFIYITDVVSAFLTILQKTHQLLAFNEFEVGTGNLTSVRSLVEIIEAEYVLEHPESNTRLNFGALSYRKGETMRVDLDNRPLLNLGWHPKIELNIGISNVIRFSEPIDI